MPKVRILLATAFAISSVGCMEQATGGPRLIADGAELPILRQVQGTHCHETLAVQLVVRDAATLARIPLQDIPVDFTREMLLIVTLGRVTSDHYSVRIGRVWRRGHQLRVGLTVESPSAEAPIVMASPYCIAVVPRCDLNVAGFSPEPPRRDRSWGQSPLPTGWR